MTKTDTGITTARALSIRLAELARAIRGRCNAALVIEPDNGPLHAHLAALRREHVPDLTEEDFADIGAQTIAYGLLAARILRHLGVPSEILTDVVAGPGSILDDMLVTLMAGAAGHDAGRQCGPADINVEAFGIIDVVEMLDAVDMEAVLRDFDHRNPQEDPVIHFYELFLGEYDAKKRMQRGVFYTPRPVVSYIVRSAHELIRTEFGLDDGLADTTTWAEMAGRCNGLVIPAGVDPDSPFIVVLDPATGTAAFLVEVIEVIHRTLADRWTKQGLDAPQQQDAWNEYVPAHLLPRLHGYELMVAPSVIAHLKIRLKLLETGYRFESDERARIHIATTLEPNPDDRSMFTVVLGNPPYSGVSSNMGPWIDGLLKGALPDGTATTSYYHLGGEPLGERKIWLQDDYVKFIRFSQWRIEQAGCGLLAFVTNHGYLDNPTFRGMRRALMTAFDDIHVLDLHGNQKRHEVPPDGGRDANVFNIQQGVTIGMFVKRAGRAATGAPGMVRHADLWGDRAHKNRWLAAHRVDRTHWRTLDPVRPLHLFKPMNDVGMDCYADWPAITEVMPVHVTGVVTARDRFVIDFDSEPLIERMRCFLDERFSDDKIRERLSLSENYSWRVSDARRQLRQAVGTGDIGDLVRSILYRPFDERQILWDPSVVWRPRSRAMPHMLAGDNLGLITCRQQARADHEWAQVGVTDQITESCAISNITREINSICPLYRYPKAGRSDAPPSDDWPAGIDGRKPNLDRAFVLAIEQSTGLQFNSDGRGDLEHTIGPEDVLAYIYAIMHAPGYRRLFDVRLKLDFPRVPVPGGSDVFGRLAALGTVLIEIHLLKPHRFASSSSIYDGPSNPQVEKVSYSDRTVWLDRAKTCGFRGVPEDVWTFRLGSYRVCEKWLKDRQTRGGRNPRPGRVLTESELRRYERIVLALNETLRLMREIDAVIDFCGGWPDAFSARSDLSPRSP